MELQNEVSGMDVETVKETEGKYLTFWTSEQLFAISISNVEQIVKKYNGEQVIETKDTMFMTSVILYVT